MYQEVQYQNELEEVNDCDFMLRDWQQLCPNIIK